MIDTDCISLLSEKQKLIANYLICLANEGLITISSVKKHENYIVFYGEDDKIFCCFMIFDK